MAISIHFIKRVEKNKLYEKPLVGCVVIRWASDQVLGLNPTFSKTSQLGPDPQPPSWGAR